MGFVEVLHGDYSIIDNNPNILAFLDQYVKKSLKRKKDSETNLEKKHFLLVNFFAVILSKSPLRGWKYLQKVIQVYL